MKKILTLFILVAFSITILNAQKVTLEEAKVAAKNFTVKHGYTHTIEHTQSISHDNEKVAYLFELNPQGFIIVSANEHIRPVVAYSFNNRIETKDSRNSMFEIMKEEISMRIEAVAHQTKKTQQKVSREWSNLKTGENLEGVSYWPSSKKGNGFLETSWHQDPPYNMFCPLDLVNGGRSYVGCPATAMSMILNYHKKMNATRFDDGDDYQHNFYEQYGIDDDHVNHDFPSFPELNVHLDSLEYCYENNLTPDDSMIAALNFACGVAAKQVYSTEGSGTYGVDQAFDAYQRFGFSGTELLMNGDTSIHRRVVENMMYELPVHYAIVNPEGNKGHNVVLDGYNSDGYFHINAGWGGTSDGWYTLPPESFYLNMTVTEGLVLNINYDSTAVPPLPVSADFEASTNTILEGEKVDFSDLSLNNPDQWKWTFEGGFPAHAATQNPQNITYNEAGTYSVTLVAKSAFSQDSITKTDYITVNPNSINSVQKNELARIFPSKTKHTVNIEFNNYQEKVLVNVYELTGRELIAGTIKGMRGILDINFLSKGIYIIKVETSEGVLTQKIIKE